MLLEAEPEELEDEVVEPDVLDEVDELEEESDELEELPAVSLDDELDRLSVR